MKIQLITPEGRNGLVSGGDRYDAELATALRALGHELTSEAPVALVDTLDFRRWQPTPGKKHVGLVHVPASFLDPRPEVRELEQAFFDRLDGVQFVSALVRQDALAKYRVPQSWVAEPGRTREFQWANSSVGGELLVVGVANLVPNKRVHETLQLLESLQHLPGWRAEWFGAEVDAHYAASLKWPSRVKWRGHVPHDELLDVLSRASALVTHSQYESWGLAEAEALASGVPVFSAGRSGVSLYVDDLGFRHPAKLARFLQNDELRAALRGEAFEAANELPSWDRCARLTVSHLELLCAS